MGVFLSEFYDTGVEQKNKVITYVQVFYEILSKHDHKHFWWPFLAQLVAKPPKKHGFSISIMVFTPRNDRQDASCSTLESACS